MSAAEAVLASRDRIRAAASRACQRHYLGYDWVDDLAQEVAVMQLEGQTIGLDDRSLGWTFSGLIRKWLHRTVREDTAELCARRMKPRPKDPEGTAFTLVELQDVWNLATDKEREEIRFLLFHGREAYGEGDRKIVMRRANRLQRLRWRLGKAEDVH